MNRIEFESVNELANYMKSYIDNNSSEYNYPIICACCHKDMAQKLSELLILKGCHFGCIFELEDVDMSYYEKEYLVNLTEDGVSCEKMYHEDDYYNVGGDIVFVHEDCNFKVLDYIDGDLVNEFAIVDKDTCDYKTHCKKCETSSKDSDCINNQDNNYCIHVKCDLDCDEALDTIKDMEKRINHIDKLIQKINTFAHPF